MITLVSHIGAGGARWRRPSKLDKFPNTDKVVLVCRRVALPVYGIALGCINLETHEVL